MLRRGLALVAITLIVVIWGPHASVQAGKSSAGLDGFEKAAEPKPFPDTVFYRVVDGEEREQTIADYRGKVVVLNFWAQWCAPCLEEMPSLDRLRAKLAPRGVEVLALNLDRNGAQASRSVFERVEVEHLPVMLDKGRKVVRASGVRGLPTTVIIDAEGREVGRLEGPAEWDSEAAVELIESYLPSDNS